MFKVLPMPEIGSFMPQKVYKVCFLDLQPLGSNGLNEQGAGHSDWSPLGSKYWLERWQSWLSYCPLRPEEVESSKHEVEAEAAEDALEAVIVTLVGEASLKQFKVGKNYFLIKTNKILKNP